jgi:hypothetical protein
MRVVLLVRGQAQARLGPDGVAVRISERATFDECGRIGSAGRRPARSDRSIPAAGSTRQQRGTGVAPGERGASGIAQARRARDAQKGEAHEQGPRSARQAQAQAVSALT